MLNLFKNLAIIINCNDNYVEALLSNSNEEKTIQLTASNEYITDLKVQLETNDYILCNFDEKTMKIIEEGD